MLSSRRLSTLLITLSLLAFFSIQGCVAAAIGYAGYKMSSSKDEATQKEAESKNLQTYTTYKDDADKLNLERQKSGIKPQPVMTFPEWKLAHNITTPAPPPGEAVAEKKE
ncbi:MAG: hypothetical protein M1438_18665 [Deltaproteobacteria bacterium]|nr:hypothetical protein [Deltaproteobacteria bacterium]